MPRPWPQRIRERLTYANVVATLALFVALGGASYAAVTLPLNSVGRAQLRGGSVSVSKLAFPLGLSAVTQRHSIDMTKGGCNEPLLPGEPAPPCAPPVGITPGLALTVHLRGASRVMLSGVIGLADQQPAGTGPVAVGATLLVDGSYTEDLQTVDVAGAQTSQLAIQAVANLKSGTHTLGLRVSAEYSSRAQGDVVLRPLALDATALPSLGDGR